MHGMKMEKGCALLNVCGGECVCSSSPPQALHKDISYLAGVHQLNQRAFAAAKELFM